MNQSEKIPIPKDQLLDERETHIEYQKSRKKVLHKDNWRSERKKPADKMEELWKGKTIYNIKEDYVIPENVSKSDLDRAQPFRGNIDDMFRPESASSAPSVVQKKPSSLQREAGKPILRGPSLKKIEVGPPAAKRHVGKQKPKAVDDSQGGSSRKKVVVSYPQQEKGDEDELDKIAKEVSLEPDDEEPQVIESKSSAPARARGKQDSESQLEKLGSEALEPRRVSVPLPGGEVRAMTPAYRKMLRKLEDSVELYKLDVKHYHMSPTQFRRSTSMLGLPDSVYQKYEDMYNKCRVCSTSIAPPPRARVSGIRATNFGDVIFVDHAEIQLRMKSKYVVLLVLHGASNLLWTTAQSSLRNKETIQALRLWTDENDCMPKAVVGDEAFFQEDFLTYYRTHGIKECPCGPRTPWPNRAESAVRLFKRQWQIMSKNLEDDRFRGVTVREAVKRTVWARNIQLTVSGCSPLEIATGRRPPDLLDIETSDPAQLSVDPLPEDRTQQELQRLALKARQEARQSADLRHDMARRTMPSDGPYKPGDKVFVWTSPVSANSIASAWKKERWVRGTVISQEGAMVNVHVDSTVMRVNQSKIRRDHDEWHDVAVPGSCATCS